MPLVHRWGGRVPLVLRQCWELGLHVPHSSLLPSEVLWVQLVGCSKASHSASSATTDLAAMSHSPREGLEGSSLWQPIGLVLTLTRSNQAVKGWVTNLKQSLSFQILI